MPRLGLFAGVCLAFSALGTFACGGDDGQGPPGVGGGGGKGGSGGAVEAPKTAFVTSVEYTADFGAVTKADAACQTQAGAGQLKGTYRAWLSDSTSSPGSRFTHPSSNYITVPGTVLASGWEGLTSGTLQARPNNDEFGDEVDVAPEAWTGTLADGSASGDDCNDWTGSGQATIGLLDAYGPKWTQAPSLDACTGFHHLYCFEQ